MENIPDAPTRAIELSANPHPGFEADIIHELESLVAELPPGTATLRVSRVPGHPEWPQPYFEVIPRNVRSAPLIGIAVSGDLYLTIGEVERELVGFHRGGNVVHGATWQEDLRWIWQAVIKGGFSQRQCLDSRGKVIGGVSTILVNGKNFVFRGGRRAETLFGKRRDRTVLYEPYS